MEPTSSPDNARQARGLARFWPGQRDPEDGAAGPDSPEPGTALPGESAMLPLEPRRAPDAPFSPRPVLPPGPFSRGPVPPPAPLIALTPGLRVGPGLPVAPIAPAVHRAGGGPAPDGGRGSGADPGPVVPQAAQRGTGDRDPDHPGASEDGPDTADAVESPRTDPWDRDAGTFGGFGLGGRNGRFLFGGRGTAELRPGLNGHDAPEPAPPVGNGPAADGARTAGPSDESGDDMNGRIGASGHSAAHPTDAAEPPQRQAAGWASVPTSAVPVVSPTSGAPTSGAPVSGVPVSGAPISGAPGLPDPAAGPVSGVPGPRATAGRSAVGSVSPASDAGPPSDGHAPDDAPGRVNISFGPDAADDRFGVSAVADPGYDEDTAPRPPGPRRSASLEDAAPARRGRRAAPEVAREEAPLRPGDVAAGQISFWDDDATRHFRAAWHEVKAEFVDDPVAALTRAHDLLSDAINELTEAMLAERDELDPLRGAVTPDTESMRMAMRGYREFLERILAL